MSRGITERYLRSRVMLAEDEKLEAIVAGDIRWRGNYGWSGVEDLLSKWFTVHITRPYILGVNNQRLFLINRRSLSGPARHGSEWIEPLESVRVTRFHEGLFRNSVFMENAVSGERICFQVPRPMRGPARRIADALHEPVMRE